MRDEGKPKLSLVPKSALWGCGEALTYGQTKHGKYSFKEDGFPLTVMADKVLRHMSQFLDGEDFDKESKIHHLHHAIADLAIMIDIKDNHPHQDDRFKPKVKEEPTVTPITFIPIGLGMEVERDAFGRWIVRDGKGNISYDGKNWQPDAFDFTVDTPSMAGFNDGN
jgi:Domain of unknown function (DUF5664)